MKKLFSLCIAILCGIVSISAKTLYCKMEHGWWTADGAAIAAYAYNSQSNTENAKWPGVLMTHPKNDNTVWTIDIDTATFDKVIFVRVSSDGKSDWGAKTADLTIPTDDKDLFTITQSTASWAGDGGTCTGEWSVYVAPAEPIKDVYTVAGVKAILGSDWNAADSTNDMTEQEDGTFKLEKTGVLLNAGNYDYKIVINHAWEPKLMDKNQTLTVEKAGYHTLTFTYNASTKAANATATLTKAEEVDPVIQLKGEFDNELSNYLNQKRSNQPKGASFGSCFANPSGDHAGRLIEAAGLKGFRIGGCGFSEIHANFLINYGGGSFEDALNLINLAKERVYELFGIRLRCEVVIL